MREIATIKVLGFYDNEVSAYIYRENIILTLVGTILGLGVGGLLHKFIMVTVEMDNMMFGRVIDFSSFIYSIGLTLFFALLVNFTMYYKLKNIKMVESLKSVD
nr:FtsX-like permease family protein [Clostridium chauvoei]